MGEGGWLQVLTAAGSIATPVIVLVLSAVGWKIRQKIEYTQKLQEKLREDRIEIYNTILEPYIILFMPDAAWEQDSKNKGKQKDKVALGKMLSLEYRKVAFRLILIANDGVVRAYNNMNQHFMNQGDSDESVVSIDKLKKMVGLVGDFLLEIRRSMGNEATTLKNTETLEWFMSDIRKW